jgi:sugar/nucleoside kinase (ribokinase family)
VCTRTLPPTLSGDAFIGALAARLVDGASLAEATRFANAAAALFVSTPAEQKQSVTVDRVTQFLSESDRRRRQ